MVKKKILAGLKNAAARIIGKVPRKYRVGFIMLVSIFVLSWIAIAAVNVAWVFSSGTVVFQMEGRERVERNGVSGYEVYTSMGVFQNADSMWHLKRRSGDLQNDLRFGRWYECKTQGFRMPWMSKMENLIKCKEIPEPARGS